MRIGTDIISIERVRQAAGKRSSFAEKILAPAELAQYANMREERAIEFLAGRFCAKEAYVKALETGIGRIRFTDVCIGNKPSGAPYIVAAPLSEGVQLSISHCKEYATASVLITLEEADLIAQLDTYLHDKS